jgi:rubredoxin
MDEWAYCPTCGVERTDYEGLGLHLAHCPSCGSLAEPKITVNGEKD